MSGKQIAVVILGAVVGSLLVVLILHLLGIKSNGVVPAGAVGGIAGAFAANSAWKR